MFKLSPKHCLFYDIIQRYDCGISQLPASIAAKDQTAIVSAIALHYTILVVKAELDQLVQGLETLGILSLLRNHPTSARPLLTHSDARPLTAGDVFDMFQPQLSPPGSNAREREEDQLIKWLNFLEQVEGKQSLIQNFMS